MRHERLEGPIGTFPKRLLALDEIENIDATASVVCGGFGEPVAPRFDEFARMQTGALFPPAIALGNRADLVDEVPARPLLRAVPLDIG